MKIKPSKTVLAAAAALVIGLTLSACKASAAGWTGCYGGVNVGYSATTTDASISDGTNSITISSLGADGGVLGIGGGCDVQLDHFVIGAFGDYSWHEDSEFSVGTSLGGIGTLTSVSVENEWAIGVRAGYLVNPSVLVYGLIAYGQVEMSDISVPPASFSLGTPDFSGLVLGGGIESELGDGWFLKAEYRYADYDSETIQLMPGVGLELDPDVQSARVALSYRFNGTSLSR